MGDVDYAEDFDEVGEASASRTAVEQVSPEPEPHRVEYRPPVASIEDADEDALEDLARGSVFAFRCCQRVLFVGFVCRAYEQVDRRSGS